MGSIGDTLRNAREAKGISLEQAEDDTKIRKLYLQSLETGDYDAIPGRVYARGFLRNYANYLGLNQEEILLEYKLMGMPVKDTVQKSDIKASIDKRRNSRSERKTYLVTALVAIFAIITLITYNFLNKNSTDIVPDESEIQITQTTEPSPIVTSKPLSTPTPNITPLPTVLPNPSNGVNITLNAKDQECWVRVSVNGEVQFTGTIKPTESKTFSGENVKIRLGNAGAIDVISNGQNLGAIGPIGKVADEEFNSVYPAGVSKANVPADNSSVTGGSSVMPLP
jgi:cytoskeletal protein RodZ